MTPAALIVYRTPSEQKIRPRPGSHELLRFHDAIDVRSLPDQKKIFPAPSLLFRLLTSRERKYEFYVDLRFFSVKSDTLRVEGNVGLSRFFD